MKFVIGGFCGSTNVRDSEFAHYWDAACRWADIVNNGLTPCGGHAFLHLQIGDESILLDEISWYPDDETER